MPVVENVDGQTSQNQLFTDGNSPSEFTGNSFELADMVDSWYTPACGDCMGCGYCADGSCDAAAAVPGDFAGHSTLLTPPTLDEQDLRDWQLVCELDAEYWCFSGHVNSIMDGCWKRGQDWNGAAHYEGAITWFDGAERTYHMYFSGGYW